jgi:hypothetical protein
MYLQKYFFAANAPIVYNKESCFMPFAADIAMQKEQFQETDEKQLAKITQVKLSKILKQTAELFRSFLEGRETRNRLGTYPQEPHGSQVAVGGSCRRERLPQREHSYKLCGLSEVNTLPYVPS